MAKLMRMHVARTPSKYVDKAGDVHRYESVLVLCVAWENLVDTTKFGQVAIREPISMRVGYANDDLVRNILRTVCEERLVLTVTRPAAVLKITNLP